MDEETDKPPDSPEWFTSQIQSPELRSELINLARRKGVPADDCEDIASEAITQALSKQQQYDRNRGSFFSWIMAITENVIRSYYRKLIAQKRIPLINSYGRKTRMSEATFRGLSVFDHHLDRFRRFTEEADTMKMQPGYFANVKLNHYVHQQLTVEEKTKYFPVNVYANEWP